jgi:hypothetical protein
MHRSTSFAPAFALLIGAVLSLSIASVASAQTPTAADRDAAATAYDRGTSSYLSQDFPRAAQWFETAYRLAPNPQALLGAIRSHDRAGEMMRAATLALRAQAFHPDDEALSRQAAAILTQATPLYVRVDVTCSSECTVSLDGTVQSHTSFFVAPDVEHRVLASFETGPAETTISGAAGETRAVSLEAPAAPVVAENEAGEEGAPIDGEPVPGSGGGISPAFVVTGAVLTAAAGGVLIWSGIDALDGVAPYEAMPTVEGLADGQMRETRTNVLIGVTAGLALTTVIFAIVTDWDGDPASSTDIESETETDPSIEATSVSLAPVFDGHEIAGGVLSVGGSF